MIRSLSIALVCFFFTLSPAVLAEEPLLKKGSRLLFIGDSITDMGRDRRPNTRDQNHVLGHSYVFLIAAKLGIEMPAADLVFFNRGIGGNKISDLRTRWQEDAIALKPDMLTILIGTNDVGAGLRNPEKTVMPERFESDYRAILDASRSANPNLRLVLMDPFVLPSGDLSNESAYAMRRALTDAMRAVVAKLSSEYGAIHIKTQDIFDAALKQKPAAYWLWDGIHPLPQGHELIARHWIERVRDTYIKDRNFNY